MTRRSRNRNASQTAARREQQRPASSSEPTQKPKDAAWQTAANSRKKKRDHKLDVTSFDVRPTNEAERAWRTRDPYRRTIKIPPELVRSQEPQEYDTIAQQHGSCLGPLPAEGQNVYGLWAPTPAQANAAANALLAWISNHTQSAQSHNRSQFAKLRPVRPQNQERLERIWVKEVARYTFRQIPTPGTVSQSIGYFMWPPEDMKLQDALGKSLEVLDVIRTSHACHIIPSADGMRIEVFGKSKNVIEAVDRIRQTFFQIVARERKTIRDYFTDWLEDSGTPGKVVCELYRPFDQSGSTASENLPARWYVEAWCTGDKRSSPERTHTSLGRTLEQALSGLRYYNADISLKIRLGTFAATTYLRMEHGDSMEIDDFLSMLHESDFVGFVSEELGDSSRQERALQNIQSATRLRPCSLSVESRLDVMPQRIATFLFRHDDSTFELTLTWDEVRNADGEIVYQRAPEKWLKLLSDSERHQILDVSLLRLDAGQCYTAWHLDMSAGIIVSPSEVPAILKAFGIHVSHPQISGGRPKNTPFVSFSAAATGLQHITNTTAFSYRFVSSEWTVKVSESQRWDYERSTGLMVKISKAHPSQWSCHLHHAQWDNMLSANAALGIGESVTWSPALSNWFPVETADTGRSGLEECLEKMRYIEETLSSIS